MGRMQRGAIRSRISRRGIALAAVLAGVAGLGISARPATAGAAGGSTVVRVTHNKTWGSILTLKNGDTLYRLTADSKNKSTCTGACAKVWPPVLLATGQKSPIGQGVHGLGTITRADGARQVTLDGLPLYLFIGDSKPGQVTGNIKDTWGQWWTVNPSHPTAVPTAASSSGSSGAGTGSSVAY
jgi:predicted lipoprotein with Yx(FWY)xxD motif